VEFLNLTFDPKADIERVSNVKSIPLALASWDHPNCHPQFHDTLLTRSMM